MASIIHGVNVIFKIFFVILYMTTLGESMGPSTSNYMDEPKYEYVVIIDAGSTGSRVAAYKFSKIPDGTLVLEEEEFEDVKSGISSFVNNPTGCADLIGTLLQKALNYVPEEYWYCTPLALKATAGLRLLPKAEKDKVLNQIRQIFEDSAFYTNNKSVSIMKGIDEGRYSWFTVNYLFGRLNDQLTNTIVALDLGGGSLQITFMPTNSEEIKRELPDFIKAFPIMNKRVNLYCYSYLGLGLMTARTKIVTLDNDSLNVLSPCVRESVIESSYTFGEKTYIVTGAQSKFGPAVDYMLCKRIIVDIVKSMYIDKPKDLRKQEIVAISAFYYKAKDAGVIGEEGGIITIKSFYEAAKRECSNTSNDGSRPFKCLDMTYICVLLEVGFGLSKNTPIYFLKTINGHDISWTLGVAYDILQNGLK